MMETEGEKQNSFILVWKMNESCEDVFPTRAFMHFPSLRDDELEVFPVHFWNDAFLFTVALAH